MLTAAENNLHNKVKNLVTIERKTLVEILEHLQKVYDTRLFAKMGYSSLLKYLITELGYSESAAYRRMQALKLTRQLPQTKELVASGELSLSNISHLQNFMKGKNADEKQKAITQIKGKTSKQTQDILFDLVPEKKEHNPASVKRVSSGQSRLSVTLSDTAMEKLDTLRARTKCYDTGKLVELALDLALSKTDVTKKKNHQSKGSTRARTIIVSVKKQVMKRADSRCEYPGCDEKHFLEWDHITPVAHGGSNELKNIRLLCRAHNQRTAIEKLGWKKMNKYLN